MAAPLRLLACIVLLLSTTGCYLHSAGRDLEQQVELLTARQNEFMATFDQERTRLAELLARAEAQIRQLEAALTDAQAFLQRNNADLGERVDAQLADINSLRGRIEEATHQAQLIRDEIQLMREEYDIRFQALQR